MKKRVIVIAALCLMTGCAESNNSENSAVSEEAAVFDSVSDLEFCGSDEYKKIEIDAEGKFKGEYRSYDLDETGEAYPNGTYYYSSFEGKFSKPEKTDENTYYFKIESISFEEEKEETVKGAKCITYIPEGWEEENEFYLYTPGISAVKLPSKYNSFWHDWHYTVYDSFPYYGLYIPDTGEDFESRDKSVFSSLEEELEAADKKGEYWLNIINTVEDYNEMMRSSYELRRLWKLEMDSVWYRIFDFTDEEAFTYLAEEQRQWLLYEESEEKAAGSEFEGGSLSVLPANEKSGELFKERTFELSEYCK